MPHFFFHYYAPGECCRDDVGCSFKSLEHAYLDAYRSMVEIGAELLKEQVNPSAHRVDIADRDGRILMEVRFDDVFRRRRNELPFLEQVNLIRNKTRRFEQLRNEMREICNSARISVEQAHATLRRARAIT